MHQRRNVPFNLRESIENDCNNCKLKYLVDPMARQARFDTEAKSLQGSFSLDEITFNCPMTEHQTGPGPMKGPVH